MNVTVLAVGKLKERFIEEGCAENEKRLTRYCTLSVREAADDAEVKARIEFLRKGLRDTELGRQCRIAQKASAADPNDAAKKAAFDAAFKALVDYRASVEGDFVCDYSFHANWERMFVGWPHKVRKDSQLR